MVKYKMASATLTRGEHSSKKNQGKILKRIHKSEREKMKLEHINELFLALANSLELPNENSHKVTVLIEATRMVKDALAEIKCHRKENVALLSEYQYAQIEKLQTEIKSRFSKSQLDLNKVPLEYQNQELVTHSSDGRLTCSSTQPGEQQRLIVNPLHLASFCSNIQAYPKFGVEQLASRHISKPLARYPAAADAWPSRILEKLPALGKGAE